MPTPPRRDPPLAPRSGGLRRPPCRAGSARAGYVALMLVAYDRIGSAWAATAVLLADLLPSMCSARCSAASWTAANAWLRDRRRSDPRRARWPGLIVAGGIVPLVALALLAGLGNALFRPATCALLPALVPRPRAGRPPTRLYDALRNAGQLLGPAVAAAPAARRPRGARARPQRGHVRRLRAAAVPAAARGPARAGRGGAGVAAVGHRRGPARRARRPAGAHAGRDLRRRGPGRRDDERRRAGARPGGIGAALRLRRRGLVRLRPGRRPTASPAPAAWTSPNTQTDEAATVLLARSRPPAPSSGPRRRGRRRRRTAARRSRSRRRADPPGCEHQLGDVHPIPATRTTAPEVATSVPTPAGRPSTARRPSPVSDSSDAGASAARLRAGPRCRSGTAAARSGEGGGVEAEHELRGGRRAGRGGDGRAQQLAGLRAARHRSRWRPVARGRARCAGNSAHVAGRNRALPSPATRASATSVTVPGANDEAGEGRAPISSAAIAQRSRPFGRSARRAAGRAASPARGRRAAPRSRPRRSRAARRRAAAARRSRRRAQRALQVGDEEPPGSGCERRRLGTRLSFATPARAW